MIDQRTTAIELAKAHIESTFTDYMVFAFSRNDSPPKLFEFGSVNSEELYQKFYELFLAKTEPKS